MLLCANFAISPAFKLIPKLNAPAIYTWGCRDYSAGAGPEGSDEIFTARFENAAAGEKFAETIHDVAERPPRLLQRLLRLRDRNRNRNRADAIVGMVKKLGLRLTQRSAGAKLVES